MCWRDKVQSPKDGTRVSSQSDVYIQYVPRTMCNISCISHCHIPLVNQTKDMAGNIHFTRFWQRLFNLLLHFALKSPNRTQTI
jgi:hypothetical protein